MQHYQKDSRAATFSRSCGWPPRSSGTSSTRVLPFCFYLASFLQSLSPFTTSLEDEASLADIFSILLNERLAISGKLFDMREMRILVEWNNDIMITPVEQLAPALDHVKKLVLEGRPYKKDDMPKVALELKKYLSKSVEEQARALMEEVRRRDQETIEEKRARAEAERKAFELSEKVTELESRELERRQQVTTLQEELRQVRENEAREHRKHYIRQQRYFMLVGFVGGVYVWFQTGALVQMLDAHGLNLEERTARAMITLLGCPIFYLPALSYTHAVSWRNDAKMIFLSVVTLSSIVACLNLFDNDLISLCASIIEIAVFLTGIFYFAVLSRASNQE